MRTLQLYRFGAAITICAALAMTACGTSSGSSSGNSNGGGASINSVTIDCAPGTVASGQTLQCTSTINGTGSYSNQITVMASTGSISGSLLFTAPMVTTTTSVTITVTSVQDPSKSGTFTVTVTPGGSVTQVIVTCSPAAVSPGQTSQCTGAVTGTGNYSPNITATASAGSINAASGASVWMFTAQTVTTKTSVTITFTSVQDPSKFGTFVITVGPAGNVKCERPSTDGSAG